MIDFLRNNTWCSQQHYLWHMTVPQVKLSSFDFTHVETLPDKDEKGTHTINIEDGSDLSALSDLGIPILA